MIVVQKMSLLIFPILQFFPASLLFTCQVKVETEQKYWKLIESFKVKKINLGEEKSLSSRAPSICVHSYLLSSKAEGSNPMEKEIRVDVPALTSFCSANFHRMYNFQIRENERYFKGQRKEGLSRMFLEKK